MRTLTLLRHAKSSWDDPVTKDFDRPLNPRGWRAAACIGAFMRDQALAFDLVVASPAARVRQTIEGVEGALGRALNAQFEPRIYMASAATLHELVQAFSDGAGRVLLVGHNPGLEDLAMLLTAEHDRLRAEIAVKYPTASLAELTLPAARWGEVAAGSGTLARFTRPRELDPTLGPDAT